MSANLSQLFTTALGPDFTGAAAKLFGESPSSTQTAMGSLVPALVGLLAQKGSTLDGAEGLLKLASSPSVNPDLMGNLGSMLAGGSDGMSQLLNAGQGLARSLLGDKTGDLVTALSSVSGMKASSATNLLAMIVPLLLSFLKKYVSQQGLNPAGLAGLLGGQAEHLKQSLDNRLTGALGFASPAALLGGIGNAASAAAQRVTGAVTGVASAAGSAATAVADEARTSIFARPWFWIVLIALAALLILMNRCSTDTARKAADATKSAVQATADAAKTGAAAVARVMKPIELPGNVKIDAPDGGFINALVAYLKGSDPTGRGIAFDDLHFDTGSATLQAKSNAQLEHLAAVLKAFSSAEVAVNGYSDNTGDAGANKKLSDDRANAVKTALVGMGLPATRISAAGFGEANPVAPNDTEDGRAKNRRVELVVTKR